MGREAWEESGEKRVGEIYGKALFKGVLKGDSRQAREGSSRRERSNGVGLGRKEGKRVGVVVREYGWEDNVEGGRCVEGGMDWKGAERYEGGGT